MVGFFGFIKGDSGREVLINNFYPKNKTLNSTNTMNKESESNHLMEAEEVNAVSNEKEREQKGVRTSKVTPLPAVMLILILFN